MAQELSNLADRNQGIAVNWAGEWQSGKIYYTNQAVYHVGTISSYRANKKTTAIPSPNSPDWDLIARGTETFLPSDIGAIDEVEKGAANGVATLDANRKIPDDQIPASIARDTELGNATSLRGTLISAVPPTEGQVLTYSAVNDEYRPVSTSATQGKILQVVNFSTDILNTKPPDTTFTNTNLFTTFTPLYPDSRIIVEASVKGIQKTGADIGANISLSVYNDVTYLFELDNAFSVGRNGGTTSSDVLSVYLTGEFFATGSIPLTVRVLYTYSAATAGSTIYLQRYFNKSSLRIMEIGV